MKEDRCQNRKLFNQDQNISHTAKTLPAVNRTYKDTLFRMIFREKQSLLQLYNALNGTNYTDETDLEIVTLENAIYMNLKYQNTDSQSSFCSFLQWNQNTRRMHKTEAF